MFFFLEPIILLFDEYGLTEINEKKIFQSIITFVWGHYNNILSSAFV